MSHVCPTLLLLSIASGVHSLDLVNMFICLMNCIYESDDPKLSGGAFVLSEGKG